jgi:hypothetical protein
MNHQIVKEDTNSKLLLHVVMKVFTTEYKEKIEKYELKRVDPTVYLYFGGEKV